MENQVNIERSARGARRRRVGLSGCPHCGGNVRLVHDVYGAYHQCLQCSREIDPAALTTMTQTASVKQPDAMPARELLAA